MTFPEILLIAVVALLAVFCAYIETPQGKGWVGEIRVKFAIGKTKPGERYIINNLMLVSEEGKSSQIDHVLINKNGIFVIETKNYAGRIYGRENQLEWTQVLQYGKVKNKFYNPIKQNGTHVLRVKETLKNDYPIFSAVVFVQDNTKYIEAPGVYKLGELKRFVKTPTLKSLTEEQMAQAYEALCNAARKDVSRSNHVKNINTMLTNIENNICPRCGAELKLRHGKNGDFYGCSNYPKCKFTKKAD